MTKTELQIELRFSPTWNDRKQLDLREADDSVLRGDVFLGDLVLEVGGVDLSARWGWIPLLDMAYCLAEMCNEIALGKPEAIFEFTESDAWLKFVRLDRDVEVSASYVDKRARTNALTFCKTVIEYAQDFFAEVETQNAGLGSNPNFRKMRRSVDDAALCIQENR